MNQMASLVLANALANMAAVVVMDVVLKSSHLPLYRQEAPRTHHGGGLAPRCNHINIISDRHLSSDW